MRHAITRKHCFTPSVVVFGIVAVLSLPVSTASTPQRTPKTDRQTTRLLEDLLPGLTRDSATPAIRRAEKSGDPRFIAPLIDLLQFVKTREELPAIVGALKKLTGQKLPPFDQPWADFVVWYGKQTDLEPPPGYTGWKGELYAREIDPRFRILLYDDAPATVRIEEVAWGGVKPGVPTECFVRIENIEVMDLSWQPRRSIRSVVIPLLIGLSASFRIRV